MRSKHRKAGKALLVYIVLLTLVGSVAVWFQSQSTSGAAANQQSVPAPTKRGNFDIRDKQGDAAANFLEKKKAKLSPRQRSRVSDIAKAAEQAQARLLKSNPGLEVRVGQDLGSAEVVSVQSAGKRLTQRSKAGRESIVRGFLTNNKELYGLTASQIAGLKKVADYENPTGNLSWVEFEQQIDGIPVFQGNLLGALTKDGELFRTSGKLVPAIESDGASGDAASFSAQSADSPDLTSAANAVAAGAQSIGVEVDPSTLVVQEVSEDGNTIVFERGPFADDIKLERVYFPLEAGNVTLAWSTVLWQDVPAYYSIVDAESGTLLWRKNITEEQTQSATYNVYDGDNPAPLSPSNVLPGQNVQGTQVPRVSITTIREHPSNDLGWIADGIFTTTGNNADAGLDIATPNGIDAGSRPVALDRNFTYAFNPNPGIPGEPGSSNPADPDYRRGAVTNIFFWTNRYHDRLYELGFTEAARNFQQSNFGRNPAGATANARNGNDRVLAEAQDFSGTNNANFSTPADGGSGRMQMYLWPNSNRDGDFDNEIVIHELTHGTSNRLHANASGLGSTLGRGMGEGWSDFYARSLLSSADEDVGGVYAMGAYATYLAAAGFTSSYYSAIRRFPYAVKSNVGANGRPHNPLTFADVNPNTIDITDGAFPRGPFGAGGRSGSLAVHNIGELWCMALLEARARMITRLGYEVGNQRMLQIVTDGMKADPVNPTLLDSRNSLLAVAAASFTQDDVRDIWAGFATRGMGFGATMSTQNANGKESFDNPLPGMGQVTVADCNSNSVVEPGEDITLTIPLTNPLGSEVTGVTATIGANSADYGSIAPGQDVVRPISYRVDPATLVGTKVTIPITVTSNLGTEIKTYEVLVEGAPYNVTFSQNFDGAAAPALPAGWSALVNPAGSPVWRTVNTSTQSVPNAAFVELLPLTRASFLQSPQIPVTSPTARIQFRHSYLTEFEWDGGILQMSINGGGFVDVLDSGAGAQMIEGGFPFKLFTTNDGNTNILQNRPAWTGNSNGFVTTTIQLPAAAAGQNVQFRWIAGSDSADSPAGAGWTIDNVRLIEGYQTAAVAPTTTTVSSVAGQYSDQVTLSANVTAACLNPVGTLTFKVAGVTVGSVPVNGAGTYTTPYTITNGPGTPAIDVTFVSSNPYFNGSSGSGTLTVTQENASVSFPDTNPFAVKVNSPGGTAGPITICADISEIADGSAGNTANATATFSFTPVAGGNSPAQGAVVYTGGGVGTARRACVTLASVAVDVYDVTVTVGGYYQGSGSTVLAVYDPSLGFVTGGGTVTNNGNRANFGMSVKYLKGGKAQGSVLYIEHNPDGTVTKVKSTAMQSLSIVNGTAVILAKAVVNGVGNHEIRMTAVDNGEPGTNDRIGLSTVSPSKVPVAALTFAVKTINGGNIQVPQNPRN